MAKPASGATIDTGVSLFNSMTACWPMLEGSGTTSEDLAGARDLTFAGGGGAPTWSTNGSGEAIIALGTGLNAPLALASSLTLGAGNSWSIAFRAKQTNNDSQGQVLGNTSDTASFVWLAGGSYFGVRNSNGDDSNFSSLTNFTTDANYLVVYDVATGFVTLYKDGSAVGSPQASGSSRSIVITHLGNGYTGSSLALIGNLTYCYAWDNYAATSTDATNLHNDPYFGLISGASDPILTADQGSFALTGQTVGLLFNRSLTADQGAYALTGQDVTLTKATPGAFVLTAEAGQYIWTGEDALADYAMNGEQGSYALSGQDVTFTRGFPQAYTLTADAGSYTFNGQNARLDWSGAPIVPNRQAGIYMGMRIGL